MRAVIHRRFGGPDVLELADLPRPAPGADQLLIEVRAASVNPVDWKMATGTLRLIMPVRFPRVPGFDVAGVVAEIGPGVRGFAVGDRVHARLAGGEGAASAEFTVAGIGVTAHSPAALDDAQSAGLPLAGLTALQGLRDRCGLAMRDSGERVLIVGASGGVGHLAVQIAVAAGARVVGVCSGPNAAMVRSLGAHEVLDYTQPDPYRGQAPFDVILDCVGGAPRTWMPLLGPGGRYGSVVPGPAVFLRQLANPLTSRKAFPVLLETNAADLRVLDALAERGALRVVIAQRFPLERLAEAWAASITGRTAGKIVIDVQEPVG